jgi:hypothetical protein
MDTNVPFDDNTVAIDGLKQKDPTEDTATVPTAEPTDSTKKAKIPAK